MWNTISNAAKTPQLSTFVKDFFKNTTMYMHIIPLIKLQNVRKRKIHIAHYYMPNEIGVFKWVDDK